MRDPAHKDLVDAIIDGEVDTKALATRASELGKTLGVRLEQAAKALAQAIIQNRITLEKASKMWRLFYVELTLYGFAEVAQEIVDHSHNTTKRIINEAKKVVDIHKVDVIRSADKKQRHQERNAKASS